MGDEHYLEDLKGYTKGITRRRFGALSAGAGGVMMLPPVANDTPVYNEEQGERAWIRRPALFETALA